MESVDRVARLTEVVTHYRVCWEVWPELLYTNHKQQQVGFELELSGTHQLEGQCSGPGCPGCKQVFLALHAIAEYILPAEGRPSRYEIGPYEKVVRFSAARGNRPDVILAVKVLHRRGLDQPVDPCEVRDPEEMKSRLRELGACERQWSEGQEATQ